MNPSQYFWSFAFITIAGWQFHPGYGKLGSGLPRLSLLESAAVADHMLELFQSRFPSESVQ